MRYERLKYAVMLLCVMALCFSGCAKLKDIRPVSGRIESIMPSGLRSVVVTACVGIDNPASQVTVSDIEGRISHSGKVLGRVSVDPVVLQPRTEQEYHLRAVLTLEENVSLMEVLALAGKGGLDNCMADVSFKATLKGVSKNMKYENIPLKKLLNL